jgi:hypothetical protein
MGYAQSIFGKKFSTFPILEMTNLNQENDRNLFNLKQLTMEMELVSRLLRSQHRIISMAIGKYPYQAVIPLNGFWDSANRGIRGEVQAS